MTFLFKKKTQQKQTRMFRVSGQRRDPPGGVHEQGLSLRVLPLRGGWSLRVDAYRPYRPVLTGYSRSLLRSAASSCPTSPARSASPWIPISSATRATWAECASRTDVREKELVSRLFHDLIDTFPPIPPGSALFVTCAACCTAGTLTGTVVVKGTGKKNYCLILFFTPVWLLFAVEVQRELA